MTKRSASKPKRPWVAELLIILAVFLLLVLVGDFLFGHHKGGKPANITPLATHLTITRTNPLNQAGVSNFSKVVSAALASLILHDIKSFSSAPSGTYNCPMDDGVSYTFTFTNPSLSATASATGCQFIKVNGVSYNTTSKFWKDVSIATNQATDSNSPVK